MNDSNYISGPIARGGLVVLITSVLLFAVSKGLGRHNYIILLLSFGIPMLLYLVNHRALWMMLIYASFYSWIFIPGFPSSLSVFYILACGLCPIMLASRLLGAGKYNIGRLTFFATCWYLIVILITMKIRGFGIRMLGNGQFGGAAYIQIIIAIVFYMLHNTVSFTQKQWKLVMILFFCAGVIPSVAELVFIFSRGDISFLYNFIRPEGASAMGGVAAFTQHSGSLRLQVTKYIGMLFPLALALFPYRGRYKKYIIFAGLLAFMFAGLSGHRSAFLYTILLIPAFMCMQGYRWRLVSITKAAMAVGTFFLCLFKCVKFMPLSVQRSVSWMPFIDISATAKSSAMGTFNWRLEVWGELWHMVPDYLLIGRGFAFNASYMNIDSVMNMKGTAWAIITHTYHNGPLSMLVDLGIAGFISGTLIYITGMVTHLKLRKRNWNSEILSRYHAVLCAIFAVEILRFYIIHGGAVSSIVLALVHLSMMEGIVSTDISLTKECEAKSNPPSDLSDIKQSVLRSL